MSKVWQPTFLEGSLQGVQGTGKKDQWICKTCGFKHLTKDTLQEAIAKLEPKKET